MEELEVVPRLKQFGRRRAYAVDGMPCLDVMRWGLVPFWAKDIKVGFSNINAKAEGIEGKPAFREGDPDRFGSAPISEPGRAVRCWRAALRHR
jgi:SOS response associated peptidase (SRAP)